MLYCVALTFKMTEWIEQQICIKFCVRLEHSSTETTLMIQKAAAMGNWWLAASSWQPLAHATCLRLMHYVSCSFFFSKHQITQVTQSPYSPYLVCCDFCFFPKLKSPMKGKVFQTIREIQENTTGQLMMTETYVRSPKVTTLKGTEVPLSYVNVSCILYLLQWMSLVFMVLGWILSVPCRVEICSQNTSLCVSKMTYGSSVGHSTQFPRGRIYVFSSHFKEMYH